MDIKLNDVVFKEKETLLIESEDFNVSVFKYDSGVDAVRIKNSKGYVILLPFKGQMVWDVVFGGRSLAMKSTFDQPAATDFFLYTYGCFMMHCGALRMGCPGETDTHPLHGELPCADYETAAIRTGEDEKGRYIGLTGTYIYNKGFSDYYAAKPIVKVYADSTLIDCAISIENLSNYPMELMYMCHVNFRPVDSGKIIQTSDWTAEAMETRDGIPSNLQVSQAYRDFLAQIKDNPQLTQNLNPGDAYDPEVVMFVNKPKADADGWAPIMQLHPDGTSDFIQYKPAELDHCTRWISRTRNQDALGIALPATCDPEGYTREKQKGNVKQLPPKGTFSMSLTAGYLNAEETQAQEKRLADIL